jgi:two-component system cell cycle sensor histidine kinase/response regulator CckA
VVEASGDDNRQLLSDLLPYAPVAVSVGVLALLLIWMPKAVTRGSIAIFLVLMVLLLLRQFQAIRDLQRGGRTLEDSVVKRTKALEQAQDALLRTERMNAIALMGAGLAHDLNNLLSAMKSSAELIAMNQEDGLPPLPKDLERIITSADRAAELTRRLMRFVRREEEASAPLDLGPEVQDMGPTLRLLLPRAVLLEVEVQPGPPLVVQTSRLRLEQMLVNLAANARDAMPAGGRLRVYAGADPSGDRNAMIEVADTGVGIPADILDRICDPFFTTKPPGKGTGLGLASVKAMVEEDGGRLEVASELGQGARFRLLLPLSEGGAITPH